MYVSVGLLSFRGKPFYNTPQLLDQKISGAKLIFRAVLCSILI